MFGHPVEFGGGKARCDARCEDRAVSTRRRESVGREDIRERVGVGVADDARDVGDAEIFAGEQQRSGLDAPSLAQLAPGFFRQAGMHHPPTQQSIYLSKRDLCALGESLQLGVQIEGLNHFGERAWRPVFAPGFKEAQRAHHIGIDPSRIHDRLK